MCFKFSHLEILLAVEDDGLGFDLPVLDVHLVPGQHNWDVLANPAWQKLQKERYKREAYDSPNLTKVKSNKKSTHTTYLTRSLCQLGTFL